jgi:hypothetical protein
LVLAARRAAADRSLRGRFRAAERACFERACFEAAFRPSRLSARLRPAERRDEIAFPVRPAS